MTPPPSIIDQLMALSWVRDPLRRRLSCGVLALILAVLSLFPQHYVAHVKLSPQQPGEGLGGALTQLGGMAGVASALAPSPVELYLHIARGHDVLDDAISRLHLAASGDPPALRKAQLELLHAVDIESVRGGVIDVQARDASPDQARQIVTVYAGAIRDRITGLAAARAGVKRAVLTERMTAANARMVADRAALAQFRADHDLAAPEIALGASVTQLAELEGRLQGKVVELQTAVQFAADNALQIRQIQSQIDDLQRQISRAQGQASSAGATPSQALAANQLEYQDRFRALQYSISLYEVYQRYLETSEIEDSTSSGGVEIIENPYVDPRRQFNLQAVGALVLLLVVAGCAEIYLRDQRRGPAASLRG